MKLSAPVKTLVGVATVWPIAYMGIFFLSIFLTFIGAACGCVGFPVAFPVLLLLHLLTMVWMIGLLVFYIVYLFKTDSVPQDKKALWAVVLLLGTVVAMPVFFYFYIWPEHAPPQPGVSAPQ